MLNFWETDSGFSAHSLPIGYPSGTSFTLCRYVTMSGESYSAQLKVWNSEGGPYLHIIQFKSLFLRNQNCLVPRTDWNMVDKLASICSLQESIPFKKFLTDKPCFSVVFITLHIPLESSLSSFSQR